MPDPDLSKITPFPMEFLCHSEHRQVFRDGDRLMPATDGLVQVHLRFPGREPFTAHVTSEVFDRHFLHLFPRPLGEQDELCGACGGPATKWRAVRELVPPGLDALFEPRCGACPFSGPEGRIVDRDGMAVLEVMES